EEEHRVESEDDEDDIIIPVEEEEDEEDILVEKDDEAEKDSIQDLEELGVLQKHLGKRKLTCISEEENFVEPEVTVHDETKGIRRSGRCSSEPEFSSLEATRAPFERQKTWHRH
ncbi:Uncharacterized protein FKW44_010719, partial [Caligus rogercresseyi]